MGNFKRGITNINFINKLNTLYKDNTSYWNKIVNDKDLFIAIRNECINVYYRGNSICELRYENSKVIGRTHYKYLIPADLNEYVISTDSKFPFSTAIPCIKSLNELSSIKKASKAYSGVEKTGVHSISVKDKNVLDVEIAFSKKGVKNEDEDYSIIYVDEELKKDRKVDRIDYLKIEEFNGKLKLVFYEAKDFTNKEIRIAHGGVLDQIARYEMTLKANSKDIIDSYKLVSKNLCDLNLIKAHNDDYIKRISKGENFSIDYEPRLMIFGFDQDQKDGLNWKKYQIKLEAILKSRLIMKGKV